MKIAIPITENNGLDSEIAEHFGRAKYYAFVVADSEKILSFEIVSTPSEPHLPGLIPSFIKQNGADLVIAYGMGSRAIDMFDRVNIKVVHGASGKVKDVTDAYLKGELETDEDWEKYVSTVEH